MNRIELSEQKLKELFEQAKFETAITDSDFHNILNRFIYGEVYFHGKLTDKQRELIILVVTATNQTLNELSKHVRIALKVGLTAVEIKEAIYQCAPYIGFSKALEALAKVNDVFKEKNIELSLDSQSTATEDSRLEKGIAAQQAIFGEERINAMRANAPENLKHIQDYLSAMCFGDFYTRKGLDLKTRELLTFCIISTLGGCENQVKSHVQGNLNVGNDKDLLIDAITQCMPYIGFPRTLNALNCVNEIAK
jgi:4-carboxymuconolactone decarboxylase